MDDNQLLLMSARALGLELEYRRGSDTYYFDHPERGREDWYPLGHHWQVIWLQTALRIGLDMAGAHPAAVFFHPRKMRFIHAREDQAEHGADGAVCRAVTRAAATIGSCI